MNVSLAKALLQYPLCQLTNPTFVISAREIPLSSLLQIATDGWGRKLLSNIQTEHQIKQKKKKEAPLGFLGVAPCKPPAWPLQHPGNGPIGCRSWPVRFGGFGSTFPPKFPDLGHLQSLWERRSLIQTGDSVALTTTGQFAWLTSAPLASVHALMRRWI